MQTAQRKPKHSAQPRVMQLAYAGSVKNQTARHQIRRLRLEMLVEEIGSATALSHKVGTPKSHISALLAGKRGMGDPLAAKFAKKCGKPEGWMDLPAAEIQLSPHAREIGRQFDLLTEHQQRTFQAMWSAYIDSLAELKTTS